VKDRAIAFPRGKVLGGSSAINGSLFVRGQKQDYETWGQMGNRGWSYDDVLPYFRKMEDRQAGDTTFRGQGGPLHISDIHEKHPLCEAFMDGAVSLGIPRNPDYNGAVQEGVAYYQRTIRNGRRWSAAHAYLRPAMKRDNLHVISRADVSAITFDGKRASGVTFRAGGNPYHAKPGREIILCAGAIGSPHLLQLSGVGDPGHLKSIGIEVSHALPGVGEGLQDHYAVRVAARVKGISTLNARARGLRLGLEIMRWFATGKGLLAFSPAHVATFMRSRPSLEVPDLQFVFTPASYTAGMIGQLERQPGMTTGVWQLRPDSKGFVRARTASVRDAPDIQPHYLKEKTDQTAMIEGLKWCRKLLSTEPLNPYRDYESLPGANVVSDDEILDYIRGNGATVYHAVSSCRMGTDPQAVVDDRLRVHGLSGLRIIDASVMPTMPSGNTNAATLMVAEKGADLVLADYR
ncbi:MAG: GMC family oxidoreductase N-terminal domain-containing protein, partial [Rhodospirillales bacterium]|nr:GMC family oxidoreductase N-terminal domain-containing protein [Rhodospirillales bacterium]